jgi:hypothetical protein
MEKEDETTPKEDEKIEDVDERDEHDGPQQVPICPGTWFLQLAHKVESKGFRPARVSEDAIYAKSFALTLLLTR